MNKEREHYTEHVHVESRLLYEHHTIKKRPSRTDTKPRFIEFLLGKRMSFTSTCAYQVVPHVNSVIIPGVDQLISYIRIARTFP